jgi:dTDP-4-dehydrorhamnose reductase
VARVRSVVISGTTGQLGRAVQRRQDAHWDIAAVNRGDVDFSDWRDTRDAVVFHRPSLVIHCAAATDVDGCERDPDGAFVANALATRHVAAAAALCEAPFVYVSTNYVFDGTKSDPYHEFDAPNPISVYGASKLAGEAEARGTNVRSFVVRTAWVYAEEGRNFVVTMRRLMRERDRLSVVADQTGNPTFAHDLAEAIVSIVDRAPYGTYHVTNQGSASWYEWASEIARIEGVSLPIQPIPAAEYPRAATPPANGTLTSLALAGVGVELPDWRSALRRCLTT